MGGCALPPQIVLQGVRNALEGDHLAVLNHTDMCVLEDRSGCVFYAVLEVRLRVCCCDGERRATCAPERRRPLSGLQPISDEAAATGEGAADGAMPARSRIAVSLHGVSVPGADVMEEFVSRLKHCVDDIVVGMLAARLIRGPDAALASTMSSS